MRKNQLLCNLKVIYLHTLRKTKFNRINTIFSKSSWPIPYLNKKPIFKPDEKEIGKLLPEIENP
jgi:hypothetical protein